MRVGVIALAAAATAAAVDVTATSPVVAAVAANCPAIVRQYADTDTHEQPNVRMPAATAATCCAELAQSSYIFATHFEATCYLKNASTLTRVKAANVTLLVRTDRPTPPPGPPAPPRPPPAPPPAPPPPPPPPLPPPKYKVELVEHGARPVLSSANAPGQGASPCNLTFNPSYVEVAGKNPVGGVIVRTDGCNATQGRLSFAPCNLTTGICGDLDPSYQVDSMLGTQDPRVIYDTYTEYFYMFTFGWFNHAPGHPGPCGLDGHPGSGDCTVYLSRTQTPANASSWQRVPGGVYPWHRNGCCFIKPAGQKTYCIFGESGSEGPGSGLGIAYTKDISKGVFTQTNWTGGVPGVNGVGPWMQALGAEQEEIKLEAGTHWVELESGDFLHFYAAATPGWVANGNYTAGYIILAKDEPTKIIQRGSGQFMIPTFPYETLCNHGNIPPADGECKYHGGRRNVIFLCSATPIGPNTFRLFFGGGDGNVGTGVVRVSNLPSLAEPVN
jgi:predicted GH43/DUF377 family glycosyl hydrolase